MPFSEIYRRQVQLLIRLIPRVAEEDCFALKGGTAINLFVRDMPRLSVDIDLTYLPLADREQSLRDIEAALKRIGDKVKKDNPAIVVTESAPQTQDRTNKLVLRTPDRVQVKIEVTPVLRGSVFEPVRATVSARTESLFGFAEAKVLSFADLYAGKVMAALDRQHPRDLFDIHLLLQNEGLTKELRTAIVVYLVSHDHAPQSLLTRSPRDVAHEYAHGFQGMTDTYVDIKTLLAAYAALVDDVVANMPEDHKQFLLSFYRRSPDWERLGVPGVNALPAVKWRELNLDRAGEGTRDALVESLEKILWP